VATFSGRPENAAERKDIGMGIVSLVLGIVGVVVAVLAFVPAIAFFNWIAGVLGLAGVVLGILGMSGEKKGVSTVGLIVSAVVLVFAVLRLIGLF
jgi:hypothetical protein